MTAVIVEEMTREGHSRDLLFQHQPLTGVKFGDLGIFVAQCGHAHVAHREKIHLPRKVVFCTGYGIVEDALIGGQ